MSMQLELLLSFRQVLERLNAPSEVQIEYLTKLGVADMTDELGLEYDALWPPVRAWLDRLPGGAMLMRACDALDALLSQKDLGWTFEDLRTPPWSAIRERAAAALTEIDNIGGSDAGSILPNISKN